MSDSAGKAVIFLGLAMLCLSFAVYVPFWDGAVISFKETPVLVQQFFELAFVVLFFGLIAKVMGEV